MRRVASGEVEYLAVRAAQGLLVAKGGIDFAREPGAGTIWQLATHPQLEGLGLETLLVEDLKARARRWGVHKVRLGVEIGNDRVRRRRNCRASARLSPREGMVSITNRRPART